MTATNGSLVARFGAGVGLLEVAELVEAERQCCGFLSFTLAFDGLETVLTVKAPDRSEGVLEAMAAGSA